MNVTPDSFSDGNKYLDPKIAIAHAESLFIEGADYIDVGGEATNPWAKPISQDEEWLRIETIVVDLIKRWPALVSLDSRHPAVAENFLSCGGKILNDVSGFIDPKMIELAKKYQPLCIINHFPGKDPREVHKQQINDIEIVRKDLLNKFDELVASGFDREKIIIDPGIGFGKTADLNWRLLRFAELVPDIPVMIGYSKKRFLGENRFADEPNLKAAAIAIESGARYLRVHDVKLVRQLLEK